VCPCLIDNEPITLSRGRFVLAWRVSVAERITRELGGAAKLRGGTMRRDWPEIPRRAAHVPARIFDSLPEMWDFRAHSSAYVLLIG